MKKIYDFKGYGFPHGRGLFAVGRRAVSFLLVCLIIVSLFPGVYNTEALGDSGTSQTKYSDINAFQNAQVAEIQEAIFNEKTPDDQPESNPDVVQEWTVKENNTYFSWTDTSSFRDEKGNPLSKWDGKIGYTVDEYASLFPDDGEIGSLIWKYKYKKPVSFDESTASFEYENEDSYAEYIVFNIRTPEQFRYAMEYTMRDEAEGKNILINLLNDLDMGGEENERWEPIKIYHANGAGFVGEGKPYPSIDTTGVNSIYIEGNGYTVYNLRVKSASAGNNGGLFADVNCPLIVKNLGFKSSMVIAKGYTGLIYGCSDSSDEKDDNRFTYLYNVHSSDCYMQTNANYAGGLIGRTMHTYGLFVKNCSTNNVIIYGKSHVSGFASYTRICTKTGLSCAVGYNQDFPEHPEWAAFDLESYKNEWYFPAMFEDSYSVNCEIFSTGIDSGCFISCGGNIIARNCYTNNSIYSDSNTGGFIGRTELDYQTMMLGVQDTPSCVSCYFENCYSSGVVEGRNAMGGFVGLVNSERSNESSYEIYDKLFLEEYNSGDSRFSHDTHCFGDAATAVFVNCYTTASVGMDYAGRYCGGFVGLDDNYTIGNEIIVDGKRVEFNGTAYINCYAAGEVGNILTVTNTSNASQYEDYYIEVNEGSDNKEFDGTIDILPYYPTGGFIGVLCPERWWIARAGVTDGNKYLTFTPGTEAELNFDGSDEELEKYKVYNKSFGYFDNCYYDMQTTAMREMAIGMAGGDYAPYEGIANWDIYDGVNFNFETYRGIADKPFSVVGITGVYTEKSDVKGVDGLTDFPDGPNKYNMNGDVWQYEKGYYPQLKVFMTDDDVSSTAPDAKWKESVFYVKEQDDTKISTRGLGTVIDPIIEEREFKRSCDGDTFENGIMVERAFRFSQASTAAVMLNHWDYKMNTSNGELYDADNPDGFIADAEVYDTVRDITSDFEFTSGINSKQRGISWEIDKDRIKKYDYLEHFGGDTGFSLKYIVDGKDITGKFNESILELNTEVITNEGINYNHYTCTDFSPGKQFLRISTYGYGNSEDYNTWQKDYLAYMKYQKDLEAFNNAAKIYYAVIGDQIAEWLEKNVPGYDPDTMPTNTPEYLMDYLEYLQTNGTSYEKGYYKDLARIYGDVINLYEPVKEYLDEHNNDDSKPELVVDDVLVVGTRGIRLLPQAYLEAGNDAEVNVVEDRFVEKSNINNVTFGKNSSSGVEFTTGDGRSISDLSFSYYNFALTAAYAVTDKIGLGIYDNYSNQTLSNGTQGIVGYDSSLLRKMDDSYERQPDTYFAMSSVFSKNSVYTAKEYLRETQGTGLSKENRVAYDLSVDTLSPMNMIGDSYGDGTDNVGGKTIVKVYKVDDNGERTRVNMDSGGRGSKEYYNFLKWSGMDVFEPEDIGNYVVAFYWIMPDGRYYTDEKKVTVLSITPGVVKTVDKQYDEVADENKLTYTITYTNNLSADPVTFALFDILPFEGDVRYDTAEQNNKKTDITQREQDDEFILKLDSIDIVMDSHVSVKGVYYTTDADVRNYMSSSSGDMMNKDAAKSANLGLVRADTSTGGDNSKAGTINTDGDIDWKVFKPVQNARATYRPEDQTESEFADKGKGAKAVVVSGVQLEPNKSITMIIKVSYKGEANDHLVNNAFYDVLYKNTTGEDAELAGYSEPVTTSIVKRQLSGYVWADKNKDGIYNNNEQAIEGMPVKLQKLNKDGKTWDDTNYYAVSNENGYYSFDSVPENGTFRIVFTKPTSGTLTVHKSDGTTRTVNYADFILSTVLSEEKESDKIDSNNLAKELESAEKEYYIDGITMPEAQQICEGAVELQSSIINSKIENSVFTKSYQNLALYENYGSITVHKVDEDSNDLKDVEFKLEYSDDNGSTWKPITYGSDGYPTYGDRGDAGKLLTNDDGILNFANLSLSTAKKYRITELKTLDGYNLLAGPIEIELPYAVKKGEGPPSGFITSGTHDYDDDNYYYYKDVTITVTNTKKINALLPQTGGESGFDPKIFIGVILVIVGVGILCYALFRKKPEKHKIE